MLSKCLNSSLECVVVTMMDLALALLAASAPVRLSSKIKHSEADKPIESAASSNISGSGFPPVNALGIKDTSEIFLKFQVGHDKFNVFSRRSRSY